MATTHSRSRVSAFAESFAAAPVETLLLSVGPLVLAAGQLLNGYVNGLPLRVTAPFAVALVAFAVVASRHHAAEHRLRRLERELLRP